MVSESKNRLSVFKFPSTAGEMELVKVVDNLGVREEIKSVRFFDTKAVGCMLHVVANYVT